MEHKGKEKRNKHKRRISCEQNKNRGIPIIVEEERWDANRGIPKLRCLSMLEIFTWGALGIPKLELLPLLILLISVTFALVASITHPKNISNPRGANWI